MSGAAVAVCHDWCCLLNHNRYLHPVLTILSLLQAPLSGDSARPRPHRLSIATYQMSTASLHCLQARRACPWSGHGALQFCLVCCATWPSCSSCSAVPACHSQMQACLHPRLRAVLCLLQAPSPASSVGGDFLAEADRSLQRGSPPSPPQVRWLPLHAQAASPLA